MERIGFVNIVKPTGMTSSDVVVKIKKILNTKRVGHLGTLDPAASGVLPIAVGKATKFFDYFLKKDKVYYAIVEFGIETETLDSFGNITNTDNNVDVSESEILKVLPKFIGTINQTPPKYSAIKINGQRAYDLARKGQDVTIPERQIKIYKLELLSILSNEEYKFRVSCSKGTYVRTLGSDIAQKLGTIGYLTALRRTKCAKFDLSDTILLESLKNMDYIGERQSQLLPLLTSLCDITVIAVREGDATKLRMGQKISPKAYDTNKILGKEVIASCNDEAVALVRIEETRISPIRVFNLK